MLFPAAQYAAIKRGEITVTYRRWKRAAAKAGGRHRLDADGVVEVILITVVDDPAITDDGARAAGFPDAAALRRELTRYDRPGTRTYRVDFRYLPLADARTALAANDVIDDIDAAVIIARLQRMDGRASGGAWTQATLAMIEQHPRTLAARLAEHLGRERLAFKTDVRKLKALGLTISHEVGYELSPRGRVILQHLRRTN